MEPKRSLILINCVIDVTFFLLNNSEIVVGHPRLRIFGYGCSPKSFKVAIHRALSPGQNAKAHRDGEPAAPRNPLPVSDLFGQCRETGGHDGDRADTSQILVMVRDKGVAKRVEHDESEQGAQRRDEKERGDFNTSPEKPSRETNSNACHAGRNQPEISGRVRHLNVPLRVNEGQIRWPKDLTEIKPGGPARD